MSRYTYDYSLTPSRPSGWRAAFATITVVGTVMAVSAISGAYVTLDLFASTTPAVVTPQQVTAAIPVQPAQQPAAAHAVAAKAPSAPAAASPHIAAPRTVAAASAVRQVPPPAIPPVQPAPIQPAPVAAAVQPPAPAAIPDKDLTFAKGYALRHAAEAAEHGAAVRHGKVLVASKAQLGRAAVRATAVKPKPKAYARNNTRQVRRRVETAQAAHGNAFGMFDRLDRPDQFNFTRHQALAFGEQRATRRRSDAPPPRSHGLFGNSSNGLFGGLF